jgi:methionyl-tRNA formyltransferase
MKIVFIGTPEFAIPSLRALAGSAHDIVAVVTQEDRPKGRKLILTPPPVKTAALELGLAVLQPPKASEPAFLDRVRELAPELIAVVAYGRYLPKELWGFPRYKTVNLHPSLLPKYRGASPIRSAILSGDADTGVTVMYLSEEMDAGDIIKQAVVPIGEDDGYVELSGKLAVSGAELLLEAIDDIETGKAGRRPQDESKVTTTRKIKKEDGLIDWSRPARSLLLQVRAFNPWPGAYTYFDWHGRRMLLKILEARVDEGRAGREGVVSDCTPEGIVIGTGSGCLVATRVQPEGKRPMAAAEFSAGHGGIEGTALLSQL